MSDPMLPAEPSGPAPSGPRRIRSVPPPLRGPNLLTTSTAGYDEDANWRRGITFLWILFGAIALAEAGYAVFGAFDGYVLPVPPGFDLGRICLLCGVFLTLWSGWNWPRWFLALFAFLFGLWLAVTLLRETDVQLQADAESHGQETSAGLIVKAPLVAAALLYLILALYLTFGSDVPAFTKHRREEGRGWIVLPVAVLLGAYVVAILAVPNLYSLWLHQQQEAAQNFGRDTLRAISEHWDSATLMARCEDQLLQRIPPDSQKKMLAMYTPLGQLQSVIKESNHTSNLVVYDPQARRFVLRGEYVALAQFAHGRDQFSFNLARPFFGPWQVSMYSEEGLSVDHPPAPAPAATPAASPVP